MCYRINLTISRILTIDKPDKKGSLLSFILLKRTPIRVKFMVDCTQSMQLWEPSFQGQIKPI